MDLEKEKELKTPSKNYYDFHHDKYEKEIKRNESFITEKVLFDKYGLKLNQNNLLIVRCSCCSESICSKFPNLFELTCDKFFYDVLHQHYQETQSPLLKNLVAEGLNSVTWIITKDSTIPDQKLALQFRFRRDLHYLVGDPEENVSCILFRNEMIQYLLQLICLRNLQSLERKKESISK